MMFAHGFGCDQQVWRFVAPSFERKFSTILFDHVGAGRSDYSAYSSDKYSTPHGYAQDVVELGLELKIENAVFVGHSSSAMVGALASIKAPGMFGDLVLVAPSPRYVNDHDYLGGFTADQMAEELKSLEGDYLGWAHRMAPLIMGNADRPELGQELVNNFVRTDPTIARQHARSVFLSDMRKDLPLVTVRSLIMQCREDILAPSAVGKYLQRHMPNGDLIFMRARGHCPHLSAPGDTIAAIRDFMASSQSHPATSHETDPDVPPSAIARAQQARRRSSRLVRDRKILQDALFRRAGELRMHLGRYDMYAVSFERMLSPHSSEFGDGQRLSVGTRGRAILRLLRTKGVPREFIEQFMAIEEALQAVLSRQEISARNGAALIALSLASAESRPRPATSTRDWFDQDNASDDEIRAFTEDLDRDILKVVSLYVRLANCAAALKKAIQA
jgi:sigma-B regulation protein RsbQ